MTENNHEEQYDHSMQEKKLALAVTIELNTEGDPMVKIAAFDNDIAAAFRVPLYDSQGRPEALATANLIRDSVVKLQREWEKANNRNKKSILVAKGDINSIRVAEEIRQQMGSN